MSEAVGLGKVIRDARHQKGLTQKQLAGLISKEDGESISAQFMNDIELDRRYPSRYVIDRLASVLELDPLYLRVLAGQPPSDRPAAEYPQDRLQRAIRAYRRQLGESVVTTARASVTARRRVR